MIRLKKPNKHKVSIPLKRLKRELKKINDHFNNITDEQLYQNLVQCGLHQWIEIQENEENILRDWELMDPRKNKPHPKKKKGMRYIK